MNLKISIIIFLIISSLVGAFFFWKTTTPTDVRAEATSQNEKKKLVIVAYGDSLTAGYGVDLVDSYPTLLEKRLTLEGIDVTVINMGVSGETTSAGKERAQFVIDQNPDIVLLGLGANDMLRASSPSLAQANLDSIIKDLTAANKKIVLLGMKSPITNGLTYTREFNAIYPTLAKKYSLPLVPFFLEGVALVSELNTSDGIHPNKQGYEKIVDENILPILIPYIKKNF